MHERNTAAAVPHPPPRCFFSLSYGKIKTETNDHGINTQQVSGMSLDLVRQFPTVKTLNLGGGYKVGFCFGVIRILYCIAMQTQSCCRVVVLLCCVFVLSSLAMYIVKVDRTFRSACMIGCVHEGLAFVRCVQEEGY